MMNIWEAAYNLEMIRLGFSLILLVIILIVISSIFSQSKSRQYRKHLTDMYVAAKIRFLATEDKLDLAIEDESFKRWCKKQKIEYQDLDNTIEEDLKDKITEPVKKNK